MGGEPDISKGPETWLDRHGDALYRYAVLHLGRRASAEDVVQETFVAALSAYASFEGRSNERTWLIGILRRKIVDTIRRDAAQRDRIAGEIDPAALEEFKADGLWSVKLRRWPRGAAESTYSPEFWDAFTRCLSGLPPVAGCAFALRELDGLGTEEICKVLDVSATNLWTMLHRARTRLRRCLEKNWFAQDR